MVSPSAEARHGADALSLAALKGLVDAGKILLRDAATSIGNGEARDLAAIANLETYAARYRGKFDGVGEQVDEDLPQPLFVGADMIGQGGGPLMDEGKTPWPAPAGGTCR